MDLLCLQHYISLKVEAQLSKGSETCKKCFYSELFDETLKDHLTISDGLSEKAEKGHRGLG